MTAGEPLGLAERAGPMLSHLRGEAGSARCFGSLHEVWQASHVVRERTERLRLPRMVGENHAAAHPVEIGGVGIPLWCAVAAVGRTGSIEGTASRTASLTPLGTSRSRRITSVASVANITGIASISRRLSYVSHVPGVTRSSSHIPLTTPAMVPIVSSLVTSVVGSSLIAPLVPSIIPSIVSSLIPSVSHFAPIVSSLVSRFSLPTLIPSSHDLSASRLAHISLVVILHHRVLSLTHRFFLPLAFHTTRLVLSPLFIPLPLFGLSLLSLSLIVPRLQEVLLTLSVLNLACRCSPIPTSSGLPIPARVTLVTSPVPIPLPVALGAFPVVAISSLDTGSLARSALNTPAPAEITSGSSPRRGAP
ncbi:hypothetical protein JCM24511_03468 [Saitozyma sp. JCM 24511]|nr:hypothetical protein JCM24511_03468 [Saitozyma sp. JCM 24511]